VRDLIFLAALRTQSPIQSAHKVLQPITWCCDQPLRWRCQCDRDARTQGRFQRVV